MKRLVLISRLLGGLLLNSTRAQRSGGMRGSVLSGTHKGIGQMGRGMNGGMSTRMDGLDGGMQGRQVGRQGQIDARQKRNRERDKNRIQQHKGQPQRDRGSDDLTS